MVARRLPVIVDPMRRPETVGDCREGIRPCPFLTCRFNLLTDVLDDGSIVLNAPSRRFTGADRTIADKHSHEHDLVWYVEVRLPSRRSGGRLVPQIFAMGPCGTGERAQGIADLWIAEHGAKTARVYRKLPAGHAVVGPRREGALDAKFADEADDAVEHWFDEPNPSMPSCLLDEIDKLAEARALEDDGYLLEGIARLMYVSRERVRQVEVVALAKFNAGLAEAGLGSRDLKEQD